MTLIYTMNDDMIRQARAALQDEARKRAYADGQSGHLNMCELWPYYDQDMRTREEELCCREMVISCVCYGTEYNFYDEKERQWGRYGLDYAETLGDDRALEIFREQRDYMKEHADIKHNVHTDYEGCTYNSIKWK